MKRLKILDGLGKPEKKYLKQAKRWFSMNPNRKAVNIKINTGLILVRREDVIEY